VYGPFRNIAIRSDWRTLEPSPGIFDFSSLDNRFDVWLNKDKRLQLRIGTDAMILSGAVRYSGGAPLWLRDPPFNVDAQDRGEQGVAALVWDLTSPILKQRLASFLSALATHLVDKGYAPSIDLIDLLGYGTWGEWHSGHDFLDLPTRERTLTEIIDIWHNSFQNAGVHAPLALSASYEWRTTGLVPNTYYPTTGPDPYLNYVQASAFDHVFEVNNISLRRNGMAGALRDHDTRLLWSFFQTNRRVPMVGEFFHTYTGYAAGNETAGDWCQYLPYACAYTAESALDEALTYHPNYLMAPGWSCAAARPFVTDGAALLARGDAQMGYHLAPIRVSHPRATSPGAMFPIEIQWQNTGVGRSVRALYLNIDLLDKNIEVAHITHIPLQAGDTLADSSVVERVSAIIPLEVSDRVGRELQLAISIFDDSARPIALEIDGERNLRQYVISAVTLKSATLLEMPTALLHVVGPPSFTEAVRSVQFAPGNTYRVRFVSRTAGHVAGPAAFAFVLQDGRTDVELARWADEPTQDSRFHSFLFSPTSADATLGIRVANDIELTIDDLMIERLPSVLHWRTPSGESPPVAFVAPGRRELFQLESNFLADTEYLVEFRYRTGTVVEQESPIVPALGPGAYFYAGVRSQNGEHEVSRFAEHPSLIGHGQFTFRSSSEPGDRVFFGVSGVGSIVIDDVLVSVP